MQDTVKILCPYCAQANEIYIDYSGGEHQDYIEDCQVCCRPWRIQVDVVDDTPAVQVLQIDE